jgi:polyphenol oxidase
MNLGDHVGDGAHHVAQNRALLGDAIHATPVFLTQVHGVQVVEHGLHAIDPSPKPLQADACITVQPGVACTIMVADCLPVLFTNRQGTVVGAAHAGWRGLAGQPGAGNSGVLEAIYQQIRLLASASVTLIAINSVANQDILVWLGPCIGPDKFEVGAEVRDAFVAQDVAALTMFRPLGQGKWLADLPGLARLRLRAAGIESIYGNDGSPAWCTVSNPSRFFSHRRDAVGLGGSGRMAACIWLG